MFKSALFLFSSFLFLNREVSCAGLYDDSNSYVTVLEGPLFKELVKNDKEFALVEFYADWCGHCQAFAPEYNKVARALNGIVKVYAVSDSAAGSQEGVQGYPTIKLYSGGKSVSYNGERTAEPLIDFVFEKAKGIALKRMNKKMDPKKMEPKKSEDKKKDSKKKENKKKENKKKENKKKEEEDEKDSEFKNDFEDFGPDVTTLTVRNFDQKVIQSDEPWMVMFYSKSCPKCQTFNPIWITASSNTNRFVKSGRVDCDVEASVAREHGITNFPTVLLFPQGRKLSPIRYDGEQELFALKKWILENRGFNSKPIQLTSNEMFKSSCEDILCSVTILPNSLDSTADEREKYLNIVSDSVLDASTHQPVKYFWIEGGLSLEWEEDLHLQFGWPAIVMFNLQKEKFWTHRGQFDKKSISAFLKSSTLERPPFDPLPKQLHPLKSSEPKQHEKEKKVEL